MPSGMSLKSTRCLQVPLDFFCRDIIQVVLFSHFLSMSSGYTLMFIFLFFGSIPILELSKVDLQLLLVWYDP